MKLEIEFDFMFKQPEALFSFLPALMVSGDFDKPQSVSVVFMWLFFVIGIEYKSETVNLPGFRLFYFSVIFFVAAIVLFMGLIGYIAGHYLWWLFNAPMPLPVIV